MARTNAVNFSGALQFPMASAATDLFHKEDVQTLAVAVDQHDHTTGKGKSVAPVVGSITNAMLGSDVARTNLLTNGSFEIWQRGPGPFTGPSVYCADRWITQVIGTDSLSVSRGGAGTVDVGSQYSAGCTFTLGTGAGGTALYQLNKLTDYAVAGKTLTVSVRVATAVAGAVRVRINSDGTGSPTNQSAFAAGLGGFETLTASITVPTNATNFVVALYFSASCNAYIDNAMLVVGSQAADYAPLHPADDLARCRRYYEVIGGVASTNIAIGWVYGTNAAQCSFRYTQPKPITPTVTVVGQFQVQYGGGSAANGTLTASPNTSDSLGCDIGSVVGSPLTVGQACAIRPTATGVQLNVEANP